MFGKKKSQRTYDAARKQPAIRSSICTGEMVAGFIDRKTGAFEEIELVHSEDEFRKMYGITEEIRRIY